MLRRVLRHLYWWLDFHVVSHPRVVVWTTQYRRRRTFRFLATATRPPRHGLRIFVDETSGAEMAVPEQLIEELLEGRATVPDLRRKQL